MAKVKLSLQKHYQNSRVQGKGQFDFDFQRGIQRAVRGQALLVLLRSILGELQKRYDKEEADRVHYQKELAKAREKTTDLAKDYQEAKVRSLSS